MSSDDTPSWGRHEKIFVDERAAIKALPQLLPADATARRSFSDLVQAMAATAKLKADGQRRLTEVLDLVAGG